MPQSRGQSDVLHRVVEDLRMLASSCIAYHSKCGKFPPSLSALKGIKSIRLPDLRGYRFQYSRRQTADAFTLCAVPVAPQRSGLPRVWIDESQEIKFERAAMAAR